MLPVCPGTAPVTRRPGWGSVAPMGLFGHRITEDTDLESLSDARLLKEHRRLITDAHDRHGGTVEGAAFGLVADIEDVLDRRGVPYPSPGEITGS